MSFPQPNEHLGDIVLERAKILSLECGYNILESISIILTQASNKGVAWLEDEELVFPWD